MPGGMNDSINARTMHDQDYFGRSGSEESNWFEVKPKGTIPERRGNHSTFVYQSKLYIYGGSDIREGSYDNIWSIELDALETLADSGNMSPGMQRP